MPSTVSGVTHRSGRSMAAEQVDHIQTVGLLPCSLHAVFQVFKIKQAGVRQLGGGDILNRGKDALDTAGMLTIPVVEHFLDGLALQILLGTAQVTGNDRKILV